MPVSNFVIAMFRIVQEALTNVARHAQANLVKLKLRGQGKVIVTTIEDDGQGFDIARVVGQSRAALGAGTGLLGIRERIALLGGSFDIQSVPGQGTYLTIKIPQEHKNESDKSTTG